MIESRGIELIRQERERQQVEEGFDAQHDEGHALELAAAAASYLHDVIRQHKNPYQAPELRRRSSLWPWHPDYWKPSTMRRDLEKAGALIAAALDELTREEGEDDGTSSAADG